jgi:hypothetical protein
MEPTSSAVSLGCLEGGDLVVVGFDRIGGPERRAEGEEQREKAFHGVVAAKIIAPTGR